MGWGNFVHKVRTKSRVGDLARKGRGYLGLNSPDIPDTDAEARAERKRQDSAVGRLNALYGIAPTGYDPAKGFNANGELARASKQNQDQLIETQTSAAADKTLGELNTGMDNWLTGTRRQLSDQGLTGGSVDIQAQSDAISQYLQGKSNLEQAKKAAGDSIRGRFADRRTQFESQIRSGMSSNLDGIADLSVQRGDIASALDDLPGKTIGGLFQQGASNYSNASQARTQAEGNNRLVNSMNRDRTESAGRFTTV